METTAEEIYSLEIPEPVKEHHWLQRLVGEWTFEGEAGMETDRPGEKFRGTETVRLIGDLWIVAEGRAESPDGSSATNLMVMGYDPERKRFVGSFVGSMMTHLWVYDGELSPDEKALILNTEGPVMSPAGGMAIFREVIEVVNDDHRIWTSHIVNDDGSMQQVMKSEYRRKR